MDERVLGHFFALSRLNWALIVQKSGLKPVHPSILDLTSFITVLVEFELTTSHLTNRSIQSFQSTSGGI